MDNESNFGTQIQKIVISGINPDTIYAINPIYNDEGELSKGITVTGAQIKKAFFELNKANIEDAFDKIVQELGIADKDGYVNFEDIVEKENLPYKSYLGKSYTKEEWEPYEKELLKKEREIEKQKINAIKLKENEDNFLIFILVVLIIISILLIYTQTQ